MEIISALIALSFVVSSIALSVKPPRRISIIAKTILSIDILIIGLITLSLIIL